ncbi:MAG: penicillin-binding protein activator [Pseudomonadales bacterium]|nr:penicillin-binding protein activator [Pseudomonadales bacterium]
MKKSLVLAVLISLVLASCTSEVTREPATGSLPGMKARQLPDNVDDLLASAARTTGPEATELALRAAELSLPEHPAIARKIFAQYPATGSLPLVKRYLMAKARMYLAEENPELALQTLNDDRLSQSLTEADQVALGKLRANAYYQGRSYLASARERIFIENLIPPQERAQNHELIFASLMQLPADTLSSHAERAITSDLRGWLSLAAMTRQYQNDPLKQLLELNKWKKVWAHHPAASLLPASLQLLSRIVEEQPKAVALLLPLEGDLGPFGRAIRDGLLAAHYNQGDDTIIRVYDTVGGNIQTVLAQAQREGAELAIGPLDRTNVTTLAGAGRLPIPVLALNRTTDGSVNPDLYQFGLAPEDEVVQVANQVFREGKRNALVLYADGDWGKRNFDAFKARFNELGGRIVDSAPYSNQRDYSDLVKGLLNVDESEARANELRRITGQRFEFTPRRRQDIDFVFLLANPSEARMLNPTLAFYYAEDVPVYSISNVHEYTDSRIDTLDLNGIRFCDIPWKLTTTDPLQRRVQAAWQSARSTLAPFYALGIDAWRLYPRLQQLKEIPESRVFGTTGELSLNAGNVVNRELMWAQFKDGAAESIPMITESVGTP